MANGIYAHFHVGSTRRSPGDIFANMVRAITEWEESDNAWRSLRVYDGDLDRPVAERFDAVTADDLLESSREYRSPSMSIWSDVSFRCWHTAAGAPFQGFEGSTIIARGDDWRGLHDGDRRFRGNAEFSVWERAPFSLLDVHEFGPGAEMWNRYVEENLDILTAGLFRLIQALRPSSMKVFDGCGDFLPLNANMAYFRSESDVVADLRFIAEIWEHGDLAGHIPPLKLGHRRRNRSMLGALRSEATRERLWQALESGLAIIDRVSEKHVRTVLDSEEFDHYAMPVGFTVLEHPGYMNAYLSNFYLAVLNAAK